MDLTGKRYGRLTVIEAVGTNKDRNLLWKCKCDCGNEVIAIAGNLRRGRTQSCSCLRKEISREKLTTHGLYYTRLHHIWSGIKQRCLNSNAPAYKNYGARGISVCNEWADSFVTFYEWALKHGYNKNLTIERIDNNGNYEPGNCEWATRTEQANNTRKSRFLTIGDKTLTMSEWATETGVSAATIYNRLRRGWSPYEAIILHHRIEGDRGNCRKAIGKA